MFPVLAGLAILVGSEAATLARIEPFWSWNTPIAWTGFILFADSVVFRARGNSWIRSAPLEFLWLCVASIPLWLVFELYNRFIENWYYIGLAENLWLRYFGYAWSFATIWPAIFEAAELIAVWRGARPILPARSAAPRHTPGERFYLSSIAVGAAMLVWPLVWPSRYLAAPVWLGFILLLDPINFRLGGESLAGDFAERRFDRVVNLALSGFLCGGLWELLNYWARSKWRYTVPILEHTKIFEMPLPGYLGFPAFAWECFTMYVTLRLIVVQAAGWNRSARAPIGRTIAL